jgi:hypothetical protein
MEISLLLLQNKDMQKEYHFKALSFCLIIIGLLCLPNFGFAQSKKLPLQGGLLLGITGAQVDGDRLSGYNKPGLFIGGSIVGGLTDKYSLEFQINFSQKGARSSNQEFEKTGRRTIIRYNYIEFPVNFRYQFSNNGCIGAGAAAHVFVSGAVDAGDNLGFIDLTDGDMKRVNLSGQLFVEYKLTGNLNIGGRFCYSFMPVNKLLNSQNAGQYLVGYRDGLFNNTLTFYLAYRGILSNLK